MTDKMEDALKEMLMAVGVKEDDPKLAEVLADARRMRDGDIDRGPHQKAMREAIMRLYQFTETAKIAYAESCMAEGAEREETFHGMMHVLVEKADALFKEIVGMMPCQQDEARPGVPEGATVN